MPITSPRSVKSHSDPLLAALAAAAFLAVPAHATPAFTQDKTQERIAGEGAAPDANDGKDSARIGGEAGAPPEIHRDLTSIPDAVRRTRERILKAARTGDIEKLRPVLEANELLPIFSFGEDQDPISYWKQISRDGEGREILAEMIRIFSTGFIRMDKGSEDELIVWPYHFGYPLDRLKPHEQVELYLLVNPDDAKTMEESGGYFGYRAGISPDGTWQFFVAGD